MRYRHLLALFCVLTAAQTAAAQTPVPISAFAALAQISHPAISPDGKHLAFVQEINGHPAAIIAPVDQSTGEKPRVVPSDTWIVEDVDWAKNDTVILTARANFKNGYTFRPDSVQRRAAVKLDGSPTVMLLNNQHAGYHGAADVVDMMLDDPNTVFMPSATLANDRVLYTLVKVDVKTGKGAIQLGDNGRDTQDWIMDGNGNVAARVDVTHNPLAAHLMLKQGSDWKEAWTRTADFDDGGYEAGLTEDGKFIILLYRENNQPRILKFDIANPGNPEALYENNNHDVGLIVEPWSKRVAGTYYDDGAYHPFYFSPDMALMRLELEQSFPGKTLGIASMTRAHDKVVVDIRDRSGPESYFLVDRKSRKATKIGDAYPLLTPETIGARRRIEYKARDGLTIPAYLTLPPGKAPKNLPLVVMPHGGPEAHDDISFDWWAQFLANRGYAVLQPQYRGSSGFGRSFVEAGFKQWGLKMQDDLSDGVKALIADGTADSKRVCIVGASYGGYAALAGATLTPDLYACVVSYAGISDLRRWLMDARDENDLDSHTVKYWQSRIGNPYTDRQQLEDTSPALQVAKVKAPILLMHGEADYTVPVEQSDRMNAALKAAGKDVRYVRLPGEDHYLSDAATRVRVLQETEAFLQQAIGK